MDGDVISVERVIPASPGQVFGLLADATKHSSFVPARTEKNMKQSLERIERLVAAR